VILKTRYTLADLALMSFTAAPIASALCVLEQLVSALLPSAEIVVTARFVDTVLAVFNGQDGNIVRPLLLLMGIVACRLFLPGLVSFARTKRNMGLTETVRAAVAEKRAKLEYRHIEDNGSWELIKRACADPADKNARGFDDSMVVARDMVQ
jgi:ATP-binding cassette subfamily B protein